MQGCARLVQSCGRKLQAVRPAQCAGINKCSAEERFVPQSIKQWTFPFQKFIANEYALSSVRKRHGDFEITAVMCVE